MLTIRGICKSFEGRPVLKNVSFDFPEAAVTALRGPSGCGKTTLVNIILGLIEPDAGDVLMPASARTAAVFQEDRLIEHFSAARNVRLTAPASVTDEQIRSALSELGLAQEGEKRVSEFSGGMRRRVAVIRAALFQPREEPPSIFSGVCSRQPPFWIAVTLFCPVSARIIHCTI